MEYEFVLEEFDINKLPICMEFIKNYVIGKSAEEVSIIENKLFFKTNEFTYRRKTNVLLPITRGSFTILFKNDNYYLIYKFHFYRMLLIILFLSIILALISKDASVGAMIFLWVGGGNVFVTLVRQRLLLNDIGDELGKICHEETENIK